MVSSRGGSRSGSSRGKKKKNSNATVWIIVAVAAGGVLLMLCLVAGLFFPALGSAREAARRASCKNNMKQIVLAMHNYHDAYGSFPPAFIPDENGTPMHSWTVLLLPMLDEQLLYAQYDFNQPWDSPANRTVMNRMPAVYGCPSSPNSKGNNTHYAAVYGPNCIFSGAEGTKFKDIRDGTSNTLLFGEVEGNSIPWTKPEDIDISVYSTLTDPAGFHSHHVGGLHFAMANGSVRFVPDSINQQTLDALFTRDGRENIGDF